MDEAKDGLMDERKQNSVVVEVRRLQKLCIKFNYTFYISNERRINFLGFRSKISTSVLVFEKYVFKKSEETCF